LSVIPGRTSKLYGDDGSGSGCETNQENPATVASATATRKAATRARVRNVRDTKRRETGDDRGKSERVGGL
jgi:hypothetical protein